MLSESFLPAINGVANSVARVAESLTQLGHEAIIVAPGPGPDRFDGHRVHRLPGITVRGFRGGIPTRTIRTSLERFSPDVVHVASPFVVGAQALRMSRALNLPSVAIYQTDMPNYVRQHMPKRTAEQASAAAWRWINSIHANASLTLAPSQGTLTELRAHGIPRTALWGRGVDTMSFHPRWRDEAGTRELRQALAPGGELIIGYVGRLAPEKGLHRLAELATLPGTRLVLTGEGPSRSSLGGQLTSAVADSPSRPNLPPVFLGARSGAELSRAYAVCDIFVHTGTTETFGQTLQEAAACGIPVVAPAVGGPLDLVKHGATGLLFDPEVPGDLLHQVATLAADADLRERCGAAGREMVQGRSWLKLTEELVGHYQAAA